MYWVTVAVAAVLAVCVAVLALALVRTRREAAQAATIERQERAALAEEMAEQLATLERRLDQVPVQQHDARATAGTSESEEYLITRLGEPDPATGDQLPTRIEGRLFADVVARETVLKAASWTHGVRRALAPEARNRIRFAVKQESKRARKERRAEAKAALREYRARQRAAGTTNASDDKDAA